MPSATMSSGYSLHNSLDRVGHHAHVGDCLVRTAALLSMEFTPSLDSLLQVLVHKCYTAVRLTNNEKILTATMVSRIESRCHSADLAALWKSLIAFVLMSVVSLLGVANGEGGANWTVECVAIRDVMRSMGSNIPEWPSDCCSWTEVNCTNGTVVELKVHIRGKEMPRPPRGSISSICIVRSLRKLSLESNNLQDSIPSCIWNMTALKYVKIRSHGLVRGPHQINWGPLPTSMKTWSKLNYLALSGLGLSTLPDISLFSRLKTLDLSVNNITSIPSSLGELTSLKRVDFSHNLIKDIPASLGNLSKLQKLELSWNQFTFLPVTLCSLPALRKLHMEMNSIRDIQIAQANFSKLESLNLRHNEIRSIPNLFRHHFTNLSSLCLGRNRLEDISDSLCGIDSLKTLNLERNKIQSFAPCFGQLPGLSELNLRHNLLKELPPAIRNLSSLWALDLKYNHITDLGSVGNFLSLESLKLQKNLLRHFPEGLDKLQNLVHLDMSSNRLTGPIPKALAQLPKLNTMVLKCNELKGEVPDGFPALTNLILHFNRLAGPVPSFVFTSKVLEDVRLEFNNFTSFPVYECSKGSMSRLGRLAINNNSISGHMFPLCDARDLQSINLANNNISGRIPDSLPNARKLLVLELSHNSFSGSIPDFIGKRFLRLRALNLGSNRLTGSMPDTWGTSSERKSTITMLKLDNNLLSGLIPLSFRNLSSLSSLRLDHNRFRGPIPGSLAQCKKLKVLSLSHNRLIGTLPAALRSLKGSLRVLLLGSNRLEGPFPRLLLGFRKLRTLELSSNNFSGLLPKNFSRMHGFIKIQKDDTIKDSVTIWWKGSQQTFKYLDSAVTSLDVSRNAFNGTIPEGIAELRGLKQLRFSRNKFEGSIPTKVGANLAVLEVLDVSYNKLAGRLPHNIFDPAFMAVFNVSFNRNLTGGIPALGTKFANTSYLSTRLCGPPLSLPCMSRTSLPGTAACDAKCCWIEPNAIYVGFTFSFLLGLFSFGLTERGRAYILLADREPTRDSCNSRPEDETDDVQLIADGFRSGLWIQRIRALRQTRSHPIEKIA